MAIIRTSPRSVKPLRRAVGFRTHYPAVEVSGRWLRGLDESGTGLLEITGTLYGVLEIHAEDGRVLGYRLVKSARDGGEVYDVDTTFGPAPEFYSCECLDFLTRRRPTGCRHCLGLHKALAALTAHRAAK